MLLLEWWMLFVLEFDLVFYFVNCLINMTLTPGPYSVKITGDLVSGNMWPRLEDDHMLSRSKFLSNLKQMLSRDCCLLGVNALKVDDAHQTTTDAKQRQITL